MSFWVSFLISFAFTVIGELLRPKPRLDSPKPTSLGDYRAPTADEARPIPVAYGTVRVTGPNAVWWGDFEARAIRKKVRTGLFSSQRITLGYQYWLGMQLALSWGTVDELISLEFDDKLVTLRNRVNTADLVSFGMDEPTLFSSDEPRNGLFGPVKFYPGTFTQVQNPYLATQFGEATIPAYRGIAYMVFEKCYLSNNDSLPAIAVTLRRTPNTLGLTGGRENINGDANPACMVYEIMTNTFWGSGIAQSTIDLPSFVAAANTLHAEGLGLSMLIDTSGSADEIIAEILRHVDGVVFIDPQTGRFTMRLARNDYVVSSLPEVSPANVLADSFKYTRGSWDETKNTVKVKYIDRSQKYTERVVQHQNLANITARGGQVDADDYDYSGLSNATAANAVAARVLKTVSSPLSRVECEVNRTLFGLRPGSVFRLSWPQLGIAQIVYRITEIDYGTLDSGAMRIRAIEDVFSVAAVSFANPPTTGWTNPLDANFPLARQSAFEVPYGMIAPNAGEYIAVTGTPTSGPQRAYTIWEDPAGGSNFIERPDTQVFTPSATLANPLAANTAALITTGVVLNNPWGLDSLVSATQSEFDAGEVLARIVSAAGEEIVAWRTITRNGDGTFTLNNILRGQYDTRPLSHPAGAVVWFISDGFGLVSDTPYTASVSTVSLRATPFGVASKLPLASATTMTVTLTDRASRPYMPGNFRLNNVYYAASISGSLTVSWSHRNRLTQGRAVYAQNAADVALEAGTTYTLRLYDENNTLRRTETGLTGTSYAWTTEAADSLLLTPGVSSQLRFNGANGSTTFTDDAGLTWTRVGSPVISTAQSVFGGASGSFPAGGNLIRATNVLFGGGDFTIECRIRVNALPTSASNIIMDTRTSTDTDPNTIGAGVGTNGELFLFTDGPIRIQSANGAIAVNTWYAVAIVREAGVVSLYLNGVRQGTFNHSANLATQTLRLGGRYNETSRSLDGFMDDFRLTAGTALYSGASYTVPTAELSTPVTPASTRLNTQVRVQLEAVRGGVESRRIDVTVPRV